MKLLSAKSRYILIFSLFLSLLLVAVILSLCTGNVSIPPLRIFGILFGSDFGAFSIQEINIITKIRLPRVIMAGVLGGALSLSGFLLQTYFQNPIAGPFVLGISSGAKMCVAASMIFFLKNGISLSSFSLVGAAFFGALLSTSFILLVARKVNHIGSLLVSGIMIGYVTSAITDFFIAFAEDSDIANLHGWSKGSFSGFDMADCAVSGSIIFVALICVFLLAKPIGAYLMGETYARTMGVNTKIFRPILILLSSLLSATVTAFAGPVSFVGIAVPFLVKQLLRTAKPLVVIPASFLGGAVFCIFSDLIARSLFSPLELSISTVTSFFGAPIVIFMIVRRRREGR
ncbi:FecCD family ABC transporter permease [Treponema ruminis]|uniref:Iron complex transport system permease protein n=1 Tax=Treponema ruminis TaxID=744515 RepID=A0A7W8GB20_9SPIR|nr:iron ABC transporter permease [Treponema ruminis]MBB5227126.1 iron complex transport system permease protein [Treponema ruminis]